MANFKTVNLEEGMPYSDQAIRRLTYELRIAKEYKINIIKLIHGYGSSGTGGVLRTEVRKYLTRQKQKNFIKTFIEGEKFSIFDEDTRKAFDVCTELRNDRDLDRHNNGMTIVVI